MTQTTKPQSLASKLAAIGKEIGAIDKSGINAQQKYKYIEYGVVAGKIRELFDKYHIIIIPSVEDIQQEQVTSKYGGQGFHSVLRMKFTLVNGDNPEDTQIASWAGEATDFGDKGINKAETSGTKYFLMRLFNVSEKGDEDADSVTPEPVEKIVPTNSERHFTTAQISEAKLKLGMATSMDELKLAYASLGALALDKEIIKYKNELKVKFSSEEA